MKFSSRKTAMPSAPLAGGFPGVALSGLSFSVWFLAFAILAPGVWAQDYDLSWFTVDGGGGASATENGFYYLEATVGQPDAGILRDDYFTLAGGFWPAAIPVAPALTRQPASLQVFPGASALFSVVASGDPPLRYQWLHNGVFLTGETNATLFIDVTQAADAGRYAVLVSNARGVTMSDTAWLTFGTRRIAVSNDFVNRVTISNTDLTFTGDNSNATREAGEPVHAGKPGGGSVWYKWTAPFTGIATFHTTGSTFDTLLAVYVGTQLNALTPVASNDDRRGRFLASEVRFNAISNTTYQIAIDGVGGEMGEFVVSWDLEPTSDLLPLILQQPSSVAVRYGQNTSFSVLATGSSLTYQWYHNERPVRGETKSTLSVTNVALKDLGAYYVAVTNSQGRGVESLDASLEIGAQPTVVSFAKLAEAIAAGLSATAPAGAGGGGPFQASGGPPPTTASLSVGTIGGQSFTNKNPGAADNCLHCPIAAGAAEWFVLHALDDGVLTVDTIGSDFDTVVYVYANAQLPVTQICSYYLGCNDNLDLDTTASLMSFQARRGSKYYVGVGGVSGARGNVVLNWKLCLTPPPFAYAGGDFVLMAPPSPAPCAEAPHYHWRSNNVELGSSLVGQFSLGGPPINAAQFTVDYTTLTNGGFKSVTNDLGRFVLLSHNLSPDGYYHLTVPGTVTSDFRVETAASALTNCDGGWLWLPVTNYIATTQADSVVLTFPTTPSNRLHRVRASSQ
jgi:hypothetical protein